MYLKSSIWVFLIIICISISGCANFCKRTSALYNLSKLGRNEKLKTRAIKQETINFQKVKNYIISGKIKKGLSQDVARKKFGEPVVILAQTETESWVYKEGESGWFEGEKIYLFFNKDGNLLRWECVDMDRSS